MMTTYENCPETIPVSGVQKCEECELDGLCEECLENHECEG